MHHLTECYDIYLQYIKREKEGSEYSHRLLDDATEILKRSKKAIKEFDLEKYSRQEI